MSTKVSDLSVEDLKSLIAGTVAESMEESLEDIEALRNPEFVHSIKEAREEYRAANVKNAEQVFCDI